MLKGENFMLPMDMPVFYAQEQATQIVLASNDNAYMTGWFNMAGWFTLPDYVLEGCWVVDSAEEKIYVDPVGSLSLYFGNNGRKIDRDAFTNLTLLKGPSHGKLVKEKGSFIYLPDTGWVKKTFGWEGEEEIVFMLDFEGKHYKVVENITFIHSLDTEDIERICPEYIRMREPWWKFSSSTSEDGNDPANWYYTASIQSLLMGAKDALTGFADFPGAASVGWVR
jgi:hypothetical protein